MEKVVPSAIRLVTLAGLLALIAQLVQSYREPEWVWNFPPLFPQILVLLVLVIISGFWGKGWAMRALVMTAAVVSAVLLLFASYGVFGFATLRQKDLCVWTYESLPADRKAEAGQIPEGRDARPAVTIDWPGEYTCTWTDPEDKTEVATYTQPLLVMARHFDIFWEGLGK
ncbi:hypothetical protein [Tessaracoccus caeni]|uniref:hypothetical protein n=1 Tax=Tessaracoccus caeni TaxID=3031239 RepID=UPI0023DBFEEE|nr:hypothetical protein [Tessaracoccus caeni]MDF1489280.1 hypothetical protein [Tessaracoccus caeni]